MKATETETGKTRVEARLGIRPLLAVSPEASMGGRAVGTYLAGFLKSVHNALTGADTRRVVRNPTIHEGAEDLLVAADLVMEPQAGSPLSLAWQKYQYESGQGSAAAEETLRELKDAILAALPDWQGLDAGSFRLNVAVAPGEKI